MDTFNNFVEAQKLIIKPVKRIPFIFLFVLATILSQGIPSRIFTSSKYYSISEINFILYIIATGIILGIFTGTCQWFILRQYIIRDWKWVLAITFSSTITQIVTFVFSPENTSIALFYIGLIITTLISGYFQWYVIKRYVVNVKWWIFLPLIGVILGIIPSAINLLLVNINIFVPYFSFKTEILGLTVMPFTQAIGFCMLKKKEIDSSFVKSPLVSLSDVSNYWKIKRLEKILSQSIDQLWKKDLDISIGKLSYIVGVNSSGDKFIYESMNQVSIDHVNETPIIQFATESTSKSLNLQESYAKFSVLLIPPAQFKVNSLRGIPLFLISISTYVLILIFSLLWTWLKN